MQSVIKQVRNQVRDQVIGQTWNQVEGQVWFQTENLFRQQIFEDLTYYLHLVEFTRFRSSAFRFCFPWRGLCSCNNTN